MDLTTFDAKAARELVEDFTRGQQLEAAVAADVLQDARSGRTGTVVRLHEVHLALEAMPLGQLRGEAVVKAFATVRGSRGSISVRDAHLALMRRALDLGFSLRCSVTKAAWADPLEFAPVACSWVLDWAYPKNACGAGDTPLRPAHFYLEQVHQVRRVETAVNTALASVQDLARRRETSLSLDSGLRKEEDRQAFRQVLRTKGFTVVDASEATAEEDRVSISF